MYFGSSRKINNVDYGQGMSFARFKKPIPSMPGTSMRRKVSLENLGISSSYKEQFPTYQNARHNRYSSQTNRNYNYEKPAQAPPHGSNGNLNKTFTLDNRAVNKSIDYSSRPLETTPYQNRQAQDRSDQNGYHSQNEPNGQLPSIKPNSGHKSNNHREKLNQTIDYEDKHERITPKIDKPRQSESPKVTRNHGKISSRSNNKMYDSLDQHINRTKTQKDVYDDGSSPYKRFIGSTREDVKRNTLEQDRYIHRLNNMNSKQMQIYQKHLEHHLIPIKDKEKKLEEMERKKREETKRKLDELEQGSRMHQKALK